jgi:hypothetical protein
MWQYRGKVRPAGFAGGTPWGFVAQMALRRAAIAKAIREHR